MPCSALREQAEHLSDLRLSQQAAEMERLRAERRAENEKGIFSLVKRVSLSVRRASVSDASPSSADHDGGGSADDEEGMFSAASDVS